MPTAVPPGILVRMFDKSRFSPAGEPESEPQPEDEPQTEQEPEPIPIGEPKAPVGPTVPADDGSPSSS